MSASQDDRSTETPPLVPRLYQEEIFRKAQLENTIAVMDTGTGKTLISVMLIRWIASLSSSLGKIIVFFATKVALVHQQFKFVQSQTPLRAVKLLGCYDMYDRVAWEKRLASGDIFFMTPQIFVDLLTHSLWSIDRVSLLIFDECHHARKNHPYAQIMREYAHVDLSARPRIFGMTASPVWDPKNSKASISALERTLDAKVNQVERQMSELLETSQTREETFRFYPPSPLHHELYPYPTLWTTLGFFADTADFGEVAKRLETRYRTTLSNLGPYCAEKFLYDAMSSYLLSQEDLIPYHDLISVLSGYTSFFDFPLPYLPVSLLDWCSPKVRVLVDVLSAFHLPSIQGIIFVEQRQTATCLSLVLPLVLGNDVHCEALTGQETGDHTKGMSAGEQNEVVRMFKERKFNLLVATSVAEEGLDFPACDLVVYFDRINHLVSYVQSKGRARTKQSKFIIMAPEGDLLSQISEFRKFQETPQTRTPPSLLDDADDEEMDVEDDPLFSKERYVVPNTGAVLSYNNAIGLLGKLCSLLSFDPFAPPPKPVYTGDFSVDLQLPSALSVSDDDLTFHGPEKNTKKKAKQAVAFLAVQRLYSIGDFDDYLLPKFNHRKRAQDMEEEREVAGIPEYLEVMVRDPWNLGGRMWIHPVYVDEKCVAGLMTGCLLPRVEFRHGDVWLATGKANLVRFGEDEDTMAYQKETLQLYTKTAIWISNTSTPVKLPLSCFMTPITSRQQPDWGLIEDLALEPHGSPDWEYGDDNLGSLIFINRHQFGKLYLLQHVYQNISSLSIPPPGSREFTSPTGTYRDYFVKRWSRKSVKAQIPDGPLLDGSVLPKNASGKYALHPQHPRASDPVHWVPDGVVAPKQSCKALKFPFYMYSSYQHFPALLHRLTDTYRAHLVCFSLGLPPIQDQLLIEALTIPSADAGFNNQRLETLGDSVLKICTTVYLYNQHPLFNEGRLSIIRQSKIRNHHLLCLARQIGLEQYITCETQVVRDWRYVQEEEEEEDQPNVVKRNYQRRNLQDCMEAVLGASFLTGGIPFALRTGDGLGLTFGGPSPWHVRYSGFIPPSEVPELFVELQDELGYQFRRPNLLVEALTHASFPSALATYQRLEFLGDGARSLLKCAKTSLTFKAALLDLVVTEFIFKKFPEANSEQISRLRANTVCSPTFAFLAVQRLGLHKIMLHNNAKLSTELECYARIFEAMTGEAIVSQTWKYDPPKPLSDVFESVLGAVFVDCDFNFEKASSVAEIVMEDVLSALSVSMPLNPVSELLEWMASLGCLKWEFRTSSSTLLDPDRNDAVSVLVHEVDVTGQLVGASSSVSRFLAAERALEELRNDESDLSLARLCSCRIAKG